MVSPKLALAPFTGEVHRVARHASVFEFRRYDSVLRNRWDDPRGIFHVIYAAETLEAAFVEFLGDFRYASSADDALDRIRENDTRWVETEMRSGQIDRDFIQMLNVGRATIQSGSLAVLADHSDTLLSVEPAVRHILNDLKIGRLNVASILSDHRELTCAISRIFFEDRRQLGGIRCQSKYGADFTNWTLYEGDQGPFRTRVACGAHTVGSADPELESLRAAMALLELSFAPSTTR
jgi:hypothetical protein